MSEGANPGIGDERADSGSAKLFVGGRFHFFLFAVCLHFLVKRPEIFHAIQSVKSKVA